MTSSMPKGPAYVPDKIADPRYALAPQQTLAEGNCSARAAVLHQLILDIWKDMASLYDRFRELLRSPAVQQGIDTVHRAYRNEQSLYRARNRRPRTELMVKGIPGSVFTDRRSIAQVAWIDVSELKYGLKIDPARGVWRLCST